MTERLDFIPLSEIDYGGLLMHYVRGHVEIDRFQQEYAQEYGVIPDERFVRHVWWRWVPALDADGYRVFRQYGAKPGSPGAFRVTVYDKQEYDLVQAQARIDAEKSVAS